MKEAILSLEASILGLRIQGLSLGFLTPAWKPAWDCGSGFLSPALLFLSHFQHSLTLHSWELKAEFSTALAATGFHSGPCVGGWLT